MVTEGVVVALDIIFAVVTVVVGTITEEEQ